jgi:hypothetical protein
MKFFCSCVFVAIRAGEHDGKPSLIIHPIETIKGKH